MSEKRLGRYFDTIKYLKLKQVTYRIFYAIRKLKLQAESALQTVRIWPHVWCAPEVMSSPLLNEKELCFFGEKADIYAEDLWNSLHRSKLWLYNVHYFDVVNAKGASMHLDLLNVLLHRWIRENPVMCGNAWEPYPISLRVVNWIKWFSKYPDFLNEVALASLTLQGVALVKQLEFHILGNHLFANAKALIFLGSYLEGPLASVWLKKGLKLLDVEVKEQFLLDGGHFERSPMYHATLLWDMCDLYHLAFCSGLQVLQSRLAEWEIIIEKGLNWLNSMTHPDGDVSFFNDSTFGIAPNFKDIAAYAKQLGILRTDALNMCSKLRVHPLENTGYFVIDLPKKGKLILDVGEIGPDYQPGHAHADTLSFELSLFGQRVFVNAGISKYGTGTLRDYQRGTAAHNTVQINHKNSSDVWSGFRVGRRARPFDLEVLTHEGHAQIECSHDGYYHSSGKNIHRRVWQLTESSLKIHDKIQGAYQKAEARFYLHPEVEIVSNNHRKLRLRLANQQEVNVYFEVEGCFFVEETTWFPGFGKTIPNQCIIVVFDRKEIWTQIAW